MSTADVLVVAPFRRPTFRKAISEWYPVQEPWDSPPLVVASALEQAGLAVGYLALQNLFDSWDEVRDLERLQSLLSANPARMVLFASDYFIPSRSTATPFGIEIVARLCRDADPGCLVGVVGRLATVARDTLLRQPLSCDFVVHGEPEGVVGDVCRDILRGGPDAFDHPNVVTAASSAGHSPAAATLADLDSSPLPAWHLLDRSIEAWLRHRGDDAKDLPFSLRTSAGCKFRCRFCAGVPNWLNYRTKSAARVAAEIDTLRQATDGRARVSFLEDEIFTRNAGHVSTVSQVFVDRGIVVDGVYTHSSLLTAEVATPLARMAERVFLGLDNPDDTILQDMRKGQRLDTVFNAVEVARAAGLGVHVEWIIGSPSDTVDSLISSLNAIASMLSTRAVDSVNTYVYCPHPGTEYAENADVFGVEVIDSLEDMQESGGYPSFRTRHLSHQQIFAAYLMSQLVIAEVTRYREHAGIAQRVGTPSRAELRRLFEKMVQR